MKINALAKLHIYDIKHLIPYIYNYLMGCYLSRRLKEDNDVDWHKEFDEEMKELLENFDINKFNDAFNKYRSKTQDIAHVITPIYLGSKVIGYTTQHNIAYKCL